MADNNVNALGNALSEFMYWWNGVGRAVSTSDQVHEPLYHYTDAEGLRGIFESQELWFTNVLYLNDPSELVYGQDVALRALSEHPIAHDDHYGSVCNAMSDAIRHKIETQYAFFVTSFSRSDDDLGQWRAYANDGRGFALGLCANAFSRQGALGQPPNKIYNIAPVDYSEETATERQRAVICKAMEIVQREFDKCEHTIDDLERFLTDMSGQVT